MPRSKTTKFSDTPSAPIEEPTPENSYDPIPEIPEPQVLESYLADVKT